LSVNAFRSSEGTNSASAPDASASRRSRVVNQAPVTSEEGCTGQPWAALYPKLTDLR
jgi:hypothetical protein